MKEININMLKTMGARIRLIRKSLKQSQSEFAAHFSLKQGIVSQWEIGESEVEERHIATLSRF